MSPSQHNKIKHRFCGVRGDSARTRDFFAASVKFEGFERAAPVPAAAGPYLAHSPEPQRGGGEREGAQGDSTDKQSSKKNTGSYDSVLSCASTGMRALASLPDVPRLNIIAHRAGVVNTAPASKAICQALAALQIALMWYNLEPRRPEPGARARKKGGLARPLRAPGLEPPPTPAADHHRTPDAKRGNRRAHGRPQGRPGAFPDAAGREPAAARRATAPPRGSPEQPKGERLTPGNWGVRATAPQGGS